MYGTVPSTTRCYQGQESAVWRAVTRWQLVTPRSRVTNAWRRRYALRRQLPIHSGGIILLIIVFEVIVSVLANVPRNIIYRDPFLCCHGAERRDPGPLVTLCTAR